MRFDAWVQLGVVGRPWGIKGGFSVAKRDLPFSKDYSSVVIGEDPVASSKFEVAAIHYSGDRSILHLQGIETPEQAALLVGQPIWVERALLAGDQGDYWVDFEGLEVRDPKDAVVGRVLAVHNWGASDVFEVEHAETGKTFYVPFIDEFVIHDQEGTHLRLLVAPHELSDVGPSHGAKKL